MLENMSDNTDSVEGLLYWKSKMHSGCKFSIGKTIQASKSA